MQRLDALALHANSALPLPFGPAPQPVFGPLVVPASELLLLLPELLLVFELLVRPASEPQLGAALLIAPVFGLLLPPLPVLPLPVVVSLPASEPLTHQHQNYRQTLNRLALKTDAPALAEQ